LAEAQSKQSQDVETLHVETCHGTSLHREYIQTSRRVEREREDAERRLRRLTPQQVKNRQAILNKVRKFWVEGVLEKSLHDQVLIELGLEEHPDAVVSSWSRSLETVGATKKTLPQGTKVVAIFDQLGAGRTLLILGEPGAGKTTTLLELTRDLLNRAEQGLDYRIPVVLNLSSWAAKQQTIADWVVEQLNSKYQIPKSIGNEWVKQQELLLLFDGLDEVKGEQRDSCVVALNDFHQNYAPEMVVCSRIQDYSALSNRLNLESAIYLRALTPEQVSHYLDSINADLTGLRTLIARNTALQELARSPLMLNIMVIAYQGVAIVDLPKTEVVEERRKQLFDAYIERVFHRPTRFKVEQRYSEVQTKHWLTWLAQRLVEQSQTVFFIEGMQPTWLQGKGKRILYRIGSFLILWLSTGLIGVLMVWLSFGLSAGLSFGLILGLIFVWAKPEIETVETLNWSWKRARNAMKEGWIKWIVLLTLALTSGLTSGSMSGLIVVLTVWLISRLSDGIKISSLATKIIPNQGMYRTAWNAGIIALIYGLSFGLIFGIIFMPFWEEDVLSLGLGMGLIIGLIAAILGGGKACIQHLTLRLILYRNASIPWNYARFLDYASDRIFLQKVGGGYIFIHRLLLEHFAQRSL